MSLSELEAVMPPPDKAFAADRGAWIDIEQRLGLRLPSDYKGFIDKYGYGYIGSFMSRFTPFTNHPNINLLDQVAKIGNVMKEIRADIHPVPYPIFPEVGGLLSFGGTDNGDTLFWLTSGDPDEWPVVVYGSRGPEFERHDTDMTGFIASIMSGERRSMHFPDDVAHQPGFQPRAV